jgi:hypothetical protein
MKLHLFGLMAWIGTTLSLLFHFVIKVICIVSSLSLYLMEVTEMVNIKDCLGFKK